MVNKLVTKNMPTGNRDLRNTLISNFEIIKQALNDFNRGRGNAKASLRTITKRLAEIETQLKKLSQQPAQLTKFKTEMEQEIRAIILPPSVEQVPDNSMIDEEQIQNFLTDSNGIKHGTMTARLMAEFEIFKIKYLSSGGATTPPPKTNDLLKHPFAVTDAGIVSMDYIAVSTLMRAKKIGIVGDSVALGLHASENFGKLLQQEIHCEVQNVAVSGAKMSNHHTKAIVNQAKQLFGCDVAIIQGTDDDWLGDIPIGKASDHSDQTYLGALQLAIKHIRSSNPHVKLLAMTATLQTPVADGHIRRTDKTKNKLGLTLHDYMNAEKALLDELNIPYADFMIADGVFDPTNPAFRKAMMSEGLHPSKAGHQLIVQKLAQSFYWFYG